MARKKPIEPKPDTDISPESGLNRAASASVWSMLVLDALLCVKYLTASGSGPFQALALPRESPKDWAFQRCRGPCPLARSGAAQRALYGSGRLMASQSWTEPTSD